MKLDINNIEDKVKDLLYEQSAREMLLSGTKVKKDNSYLIIAIAASFLLLISYIGLQFLNKPIDRYAIADKYYEFPSINKSRSGESNIVDDFIPELDNREYEKVLNQLSNNTLSEKDLYTKIHLYYTLDSLDQAKSIIENKEWIDNTHKEDLMWVQFLIYFKNGENKEKLLNLANMLDVTYQKRAMEMISNIE
jgi:hypothetical protein